MGCYALLALHPLRDPLAPCAPSPSTTAKPHNSGGGLVIVAYLATMGFLSIKMPSYMSSQHGDY
jgi:hypothetical protein